MTYGRKIGGTPLRHVQRVRRLLSDGRYNIHFYHRNTRTKLPGLPGSPEFLAAYDAAESRLPLLQKAKLLAGNKQNHPPDISPIVSNRGIYREALALLGPRAFGASYSSILSPITKDCD